MYSICTSYSLPMHGAWELHSVINSRRRKSFDRRWGGFSKACLLLKGSRMFQADCKCILLYVHRDPKIGGRRGPRRMHRAQLGVGPCMHDTCVFNVVRPKSSSIIRHIFRKRFPSLLCHIDSMSAGLFGWIMEGKLVHKLYLSISRMISRSHFEGQESSLISTSHSTKYRPSPPARTIIQ